MNFSVFFLLFISLDILSTNNMNIYNVIKVIPSDNHGWFGPDNETGLAKVISKINPKICVEIGSWLGLSTTYIAARLSDDSILYAVDTWLGSLEHNQSWREDTQKRLPTLYQQFLSNIIHSGFHNRIFPLRMSSVEASLALNEENIDMVYIDGSHFEEDVYNDFISWWPKIGNTGMLCGDDWRWGSDLRPGDKWVPGGVRRAMQKLGIASKHLHVEGNFWWIDPKNNINKDF